MRVIDREMKEVLKRLLKQSQCEYVFTSPQDPAKPLGPWVLEEQISQVRKKIETHPDAGLHALRHTLRFSPRRESTRPLYIAVCSGTR